MWALRRDSTVLMALPSFETADEKALLDMAKQIRRFDRNRALVGVVTFLHLIGAYTLVFAPDNQLFTQGTLPVFMLFSPLVWAVPFLIGGLGAASLLWRVTAFRQIVTWAAVIPTQMVWTGASAIAIYEGGGSAMFVVFLVAVFAFTVITAVVMAYDFTTGKR